MIKGLVTGLLFTCFLSVANAQTTGFIREKIITKVTARCQDRQHATKPAGATPQMIEKYCACNATYMADKLTEDQVFKLQDNTPPGPSVEMVQAANKSCAAELEKG